MKVLFLDMDGVINTSKTCALLDKFVDGIGFNQLNKDCVTRLNEITDATDTKIIISSTWRIGCRYNNTESSLFEHLYNEGVTGEIIGTTPLSYECVPDSNGFRGMEIQYWLNYVSFL